eukprot:RCo052540
MQVPLHKILVNLHDRRDREDVSLKQAYESFVKHSAPTYGLHVGSGFFDVDGIVDKIRIFLRWLVQSPLLMKFGVLKVRRLIRAVTQALRAHTERRKAALEAVVRQWELEEEKERAALISSMQGKPRRKADMTRLSKVIESSEVKWIVVKHLYFSDLAAYHKRLRAHNAEIRAQFHALKARFRPSLRNDLSFKLARNNFETTVNKHIEFKFTADLPRLLSAVEEVRPSLRLLPRKPKDDPSDLRCHGSSSSDGVLEDTPASPLQRASNSSGQFARAESSTRSGMKRVQSLVMAPPVASPTGRCSSKIAQGAVRFDSNAVDSEDDPLASSGGDHSGSSSSDVNSGSHRIARNHRLPGSPESMPLPTSDELATLGESRPETPSRTYQHQPSVSFNHTSSSRSLKNRSFSESSHSLRRSPSKSLFPDECCSAQSSKGGLQPQNLRTRGNPSSDPADSSSRPTSPEGQSELHRPFSFKGLGSDPSRGHRRRLSSLMALRPQRICASLQELPHAPVPKQSTEQAATRSGKVQPSCMRAQCSEVSDTDILSPTSAPPRAFGRSPSFGEDLTHHGARSSLSPVFGFLQPATAHLVSSIAHSGMSGSFEVVSSFEPLPHSFHSDPSARVPCRKLTSLEAARVSPKASPSRVKFIMQPPDLGAAISHSSPSQVLSPARQISPMRSEQIQPKQGSGLVESPMRTRNCPAPSVFPTQSREEVICHPTRQSSSTSDPCPSLTLRKESRTAGEGVPAEGRAFSFFPDLGRAHC